MTELSAKDLARELTVLAWRRTLLRWVVVAVVAARVFADELGALVVVAALTVLVAAAVLNFAASREYSDATTHSGLPSPPVPRALRRPAVRLGALVAGTLLVGVLALVWVLLG